VKRGSSEKIVKILSVCPFFHRFLDDDVGWTSYCEAAWTEETLSDW
jgi:hypothetical protein